MSLVLQYEESLWTVSLTTPDKLQKHMPDGEWEMIKRPMVRNEVHKNCVFIAATHTQLKNSKLIRVRLDPA